MKLVSLLPLLLVFFCNVLSTDKLAAAMDVATLSSSCWEDNSDRIENVDKANACYRNQNTDEPLCFMFQNDTDKCRNGWKEPVVSNMNNFNYVVETAKYLLTPNSTFTVRMELEIRLQRFLNSFTSECVSQVVSKNVSKKTILCATFEIDQDGYKMRFFRIGKKVSCQRQSDDYLLCLADVIQPTTTRTVYEVTASGSTNTNRFYTSSLPTSSLPLYTDATTSGSTITNRFYTSRLTSSISLSTDVTTSGLKHPNRFYTSDIPTSYLRLSTDYTMKIKKESTNANVIAEIDSCWTQVSPNIERIGRNDLCYNSDNLDKRRCYKFEDNFQECGEEWTKSIIHNKQEFDYIITKAKYHLTPNSRFTIKMELDMKAKQFINKFTSDCVNQTIHSNVMMKKNGCATFEIYEDGYHMEIYKVSKDKPCTSSKDDKVACFTSVKPQELTTKAFTYTTDSSDIQASTDTFSVSLIVMVIAVSVLAVIVLSLGCFCYGKFKERKTHQTAPEIPAHGKGFNEGVVIPMQSGIANATYEYPYEPEPLYAAINDNGLYTDLLRSRSESALHFEGGQFLPQTRSLQRLVPQRVAENKWSTLPYQTKIQSKVDANASIKRKYLTSSQSGFNNTDDLVRKFHSSQDIHRQTQDRVHYRSQDGSINFSHDDKVNHVNETNHLDQDGYMKSNFNSGHAHNDDLYLTPIATSDDSSTQKEKCNDIVNRAIFPESTNLNSAEREALPAYTTLNPTDINTYTALEQDSQGLTPSTYTDLTNTVKVVNETNLESTYISLEPTPNDDYTSMAN